MRLLLSLALLVFSADPGLARGRVEHWSALSRTATGITGDIALSPTLIRMAGKRLSLRVAADVPAFKSDLGVFPARILEVTSRTNPVLRNGNTLCGRDAPRWLVVYRFDRESLGMAVYRGEARPTSIDDPGLCGTLNYIR